MMWVLFAKQALQATSSAGLREAKPLPMPCGVDVPGWSLAWSAGWLPAHLISAIWTGESVYVPDIAGAGAEQ